MSTQKSVAAAIARAFGMVIGALATLVVVLALLALIGWLGSVVVGLWS